MIMRKLTLGLALAIGLTFTASASADVGTGHGGWGHADVSCRPYGVNGPHLTTNVQMAMDNDMASQPVIFKVTVERWNGSEWRTRSTFTHQMLAGYPASYPRAFFVPHGYYYRVHVLYGWARGSDNSANLWGSERIKLYQQYSSNFYVRKDYCWV
jgi:hypothetical protein